MAQRFSTRILYLNLTKRRDELGLTDREIAERVGVRQSWWRGLLKGRCLADPDELQRICEVLGVPPDQVPHRHLPPVDERPAAA